MKRPHVHAVIYGFPGAKKSTCASTFPTPIYVCNFDGRSKAGPYLRTGDKVEDSRTKDLGVPIQRVYDGKTLVAEIHHYQDPDPERPDAFGLFRQEQRNFDPTKWGTWVFDSVTSGELAARLEQQFVINPNTKDPRQWFAGATDQLERQLVRRATSYECNAVVICHITEEYVDVPASKDAPAKRIDKRVEFAERTNTEGDVTRTQLVRSISAPGRLSKRHALISQYSECYRAYILFRDGKQSWWLQTEPDEEWIANTQIPAPNPCTPDYDKLWSRADKTTR
jgi:hypothetical protein